jgi:hypothetical protein
MDYSSFNDFFECLGFTYNKSNYTDGNNSDGGIGAPFGCNDIPNGFQDMPPELFTIIGELLGNVIGGNLPFNVQNSVGNWLMLVGQAIITLNAQQQYFETGPGRYYDVRNKNVLNSFCTNQSSQASQTQSSSDVDSLKSDLKELKKEVNELRSQLEKLRN